MASAIGVYRAEDPRSRVLKRTAKELARPRVRRSAEELEQVAHESRSRARTGPLVHESRVLVAIGLDVAEVPRSSPPAMFACSRRTAAGLRTRARGRTRLIRRS